MAFKVLEVFVVVERMISDRVVLLGRRVYNRGILVRESRYIDTVLFGEQCFQWSTTTENRIQL